MEVALAVHRLLGGRRDERCEDRQRVEERQEGAAAMARTLRNWRQKIRAGDCGGTSTVSADNRVEGQGGSRSRR